jgi:hypothetical protein
LGTLAEGCFTKRRAAEGTVAVQKLAEGCNPPMVAENALFLQVMCSDIPISTRPESVRR